VPLDTNTKRLLSNLETESQKVSQNIMLLLSTVEQLQHLITERDKQKGCVEALSFWLGSANANHASHEVTATSMQEDQFEHGVQEDVTALTRGSIEISIDMDIFLIRYRSA